MNFSPKESTHLDKLYSMINDISLIIRVFFNENGFRTNILHIVKELRGDLCTLDEKTSLEKKAIYDLIERIKSEIHPIQLDLFDNEQ